MNTQAFAAWKLQLCDGDGTFACGDNNALFAHHGDRAALIEAIPYYTAGIQEGAKLSGAFSQWINNAQGAAGSLLSNPMAAAQLTSSLGDATTIARNLPALLSAWSGTSQSFMSYASANQLDVSTLQTALNTN